MRDLAGRPELLALNTATLGHREPLAGVIDAVAAAGFGAIAPWRHDLDESQAAAEGKRIRDAGLKVSGYCRTAYLSAPDAAGRAAAVADNVRALHAAAELGAECFVAVVGGLAAGSRDCADSRKQILDGLAQLAETAAELKVPIALEPLHPAYAADRSLLCTTAQALQWCGQLDPDGRGDFGVCLDAYHVWWDPERAASIAAAKGRIMGYHVCDWLVPTRDILLDRGMPGDGVIDLRSLRAEVEAAGWDSWVEVEIFSAEDWWKRPKEEVLATCVERMTSLC
ncbi:MAG: sugar phosphate isomerase/epimerase [Betaproteobacteria bacterium AqS2]|uniref:Sugar phosphate isomerase/epimerase n=1 Tax=Candidatus Amphirhobacter heronislandensis TaxID=1732024 RepID=A0A930UC30_9GAMM|nr:sugar phosphate isomerase/epimerase [Betaproteobacteria bacterium AqS2]